MLVTCPKCGKNSSIPSSRLSDPAYEIKCLNCQSAFKPVEAAAPQLSSPGAGHSAKPVSPEPVTSRPVTPAPARPLVAVDFRHCANHGQLSSACVCPVCNKGFCAQCVRMVQTAYICLECGGLCIRPDQYERKVNQSTQRVRSMWEELGTILTYPFVDTVSFLILSVIVWIFSALGSFAMMYGGGAVLFSQGLLAAYSFSALYRVTDGNMKSYLPDISDIYDLVTPLWLGFAALLISSAPLIILFFTSGVPMLFGTMNDPIAAVERPAAVDEVPVHHGFQLVSVAEANQDDDEESALDAAEEDEGYQDEEGMEDDSEEIGEGEKESPGDAEVDEEMLRMDEEEGEDHFDEDSPFYSKLLLFIGALWKLGYAPAAFIVAGVSRSFLQTINPLVGIDSIKRMGKVYWEAVLIYTAITVPQFLSAIPLNDIPFAGSFIKALIDSYAALVIGCTLGLVVRKKAPELGLE